MILDSVRDNLKILCLAFAKSSDATVPSDQGKLETRIYVCMCARVRVFVFMNIKIREHERESVKERV